MCVSSCLFAHGPNLRASRAEAMARQTNEQKLQEALDLLGQQAGQIAVLQEGHRHSHLRAEEHAEQIKALQQQMVSLTVARSYASQGGHVDDAVRRSDAGPGAPAADAAADAVQQVNTEGFFPLAQGGIWKAPPPPPLPPSALKAVGWQTEVKWPPGVPENVCISSPACAAIPQEPWRVEYLDSEGHKVWRCLLCPYNKNYGEWQHQSHFESKEHQTKLRNKAPKDWTLSINIGERNDVPELFNGNGIVPGYNDV